MRGYEHCYVKVYIKNIIDARDKLKNYTGNDEASQKMRFSLENGKKNICEQAHKYLKSQAEKTYGTSNVLVHTRDNSKLFKNWSEYFMDPPQNLTDFGMQYADTVLLGEDYSPKEMEAFL